jgi:hypothetical protein
MMRDLLSILALFADTSDHRFSALQALLAFAIFLTLQLSLAKNLSCVQGSAEPDGEFIDSTRP